MVSFNLPLEQNDYFVVGRDENWTYITDLSVPGVEYGRYLISDFGRAFDLRNKCRCHEYDFSGYKTITLNGLNGYHTYLLHRIVIIEFVGYSNIAGYDIVNHKNGIKYCCFIENLEWTTMSGNINHAIDIGLNTNVGEDAMLAKMTNEDALNIMYQLRDGVPIKDIAKTIPDCITKPLSLIYSIKNGKA